jgi:catalase-peroxidase
MFGFVYIKIYVNPEGPMGEPDVAGAADTIRDVFGRMDWHGRELVALIGGGHTFGKAHGASTQSNGIPPNKCPYGVQSWDGPVGVNAITSGFEGPWTSTPLQWDNHYFQYLVNYEWEPIKGPGGHFQWQINTDNSNTTTMDIPKAPSADPSQEHDHSKKQNVMMLTTDIALKHDEEYRQYVAEFANNESAFKEAFAKAWYKLVTRDVGPISRCAGTVCISYSLYLFRVVCFIVRRLKFNRFFFHLQKP